MPCDSVRLTPVRLDKCNPALMLAGLQDMGHTNAKLAADGHTIYFGNGESINCQTGQSQLSKYNTADAIKRAYSGAVVKATARKFGWQPNAQNTSTQFQFQRR